MVTQKRVKELFDYSEGNLIRRVSRGKKSPAGASVGYLCGGRYLRLLVNYKIYYVHRLIWLWNFGYFPESEIDHIDGNCTNNRIENLREVSHACNLRNTGNRRDNTSGVKGVTKNKSNNNKWSPFINIGKKIYSIGYYSDLVEAVAHRLAVEQCLGWGSCKNNSPALLFMQEYLKNK